MSEPIIDTLYRNIMFDLDTIRIEQTSISEPEKSFELLKLLNQITNNINDRFNEVRGE